MCEQTGRGGAFSVCERKCPDHVLLDLNAQGLIPLRIIIDLVAPQRLRCHQCQRVGVEERKLRS